GLDQRRRERAVAGGQRGVGRQQHRGSCVGAAEVDGPGIARVRVSERILGGHRQAEGAARRGRGRGRGQDQPAGWRGVDRQRRGGGEVIRGVGRGQRLATRSNQGCREAALPIDQRGVGRQHHSDGGVAAAEMHRAAVIGRQISETVVGYHRDGEAIAGGRGRGGGRQLQGGRRGGAHRQVGGCDEVTGGVGRGQGLRPGLDQGGREGALAAGQRRV